MHANMVNSTKAKYMFIIGHIARKRTYFWWTV